MTLAESNEPFDPCLVCPVSGEPLFLTKGKLTTADRARSYEIGDGYYGLFALDEGDAPSVTGDVLAFYTESPFPNYSEFDDLKVFVQKADESVFARMLTEEVPTNANILEVGAGTCQMSNYLAATTMSHVYAADLTSASLRLGVEFARNNNLCGITFVQMNLFRPCIREASIDILICNGVLHHTADTKAAFQSIAPLVKPGGYILIGLYNWLGRLRTDFRRLLYQRFGEAGLFSDPHLRYNLSPEKRKAWIRDQYIHPAERKHSYGEVLSWFEEAGYDFVSSIPKIQGSLTAGERLFTPNDPGSSLDQVLTELGMLFTRQGGRRRPIYHDRSAPLIAVVT